MKVINEKGKLFGLINIIDLCVLLVLVLVVGAVGVKFVGKKAQGPVVQPKDVYFTVRCPLFPESAVVALNESKKLVSESNFTDAEIVNVKSNQADYTVPTADGRLNLTKHPLWKDIYITIKIKATPDQATLRIGRQEIHIGGDYIVKTQRVELKGVVQKVEFR